jgi:hypothetical protein
MAATEQYLEYDQEVHKASQGPMLWTRPDPLPLPEPYAVVRHVQPGARVQPPRFGLHRTRLHGVGRGASSAFSPPTPPRKRSTKCKVDSFCTL